MQFMWGEQKLIVVYRSSTLSLKISTPYIYFSNSSQHCSMMSTAWNLYWSSLHRD